MHENNDHHLAGAWWVILQSPDLFHFYFPESIKLQIIAQIVKNKCDTYFGKNALNAVDFKKT